MTCSNPRIIRPGVLTMLALGVGGCFFLFPLSDPEKSSIDPRLAGIWTMSKDQTTETYAIYPFDSRAYVVEHARGEGGKLASRGLFKAFLTPMGDELYLNVQHISPDMLWDKQREDELMADKDMSDTQKKIIAKAAKKQGIITLFSVAKITFGKDSLTVQVFNAGKPPKEDMEKLDSSASVAQYVHGHPEYLGEVQTFTRVEPARADAVFPKGWKKAEE